MLREVREPVTTKTRLFQARNAIAVGIVARAQHTLAIFTGNPGIFSITQGHMERAVLERPYKHTIFALVLVVTQRHLTTDADHRTQRPRLSRTHFCHSLRGGRVCDHSMT